MDCESCGGPLDCYQSEWYCPRCTYFGMLELAEQADAEARRERQVPAPADDGPPDDCCPW